MTRIWVPLLYLISISALLFAYQDWLIRAWLESPLDREGRYQFVFGIFATSFVGVFAKPDTMGRLDFKALPFVLIMLVSYLLSGWLNINSAAVISAMLFSWSLIWLFKGTRIALVALGFTLIAVLGAPAVTFILDLARVKVGIEQLDATETRRLVTLSVLLSLPLLMLMAKRATTLGHKGRFVGYVASVSVLLMALTNAQREESKGPLFRLPTDLYTVDSWIGADIELNPGEARLFGESNYLKRIYTRTDGGSVSLLKVVSDNIHDIHTPEYCWTGSGWQVIERTPLKDGEESWLPAAATQLTLRQNKRDLTIVYWFTNGEFSTGEVSDLRLWDRFSDSKHYDLHILTDLVTTGASTDLLSDFVGVIRGGSK